jgi:hypothetical protein
VVVCACGLPRCPHLPKDEREALDRFWANRDLQPMSDPRPDRPRRRRGGGRTKPHPSSRTRARIRELLGIETVRALGWRFGFNPRTISKVLRFDP